MENRLLKHAVDDAVWILFQVPLKSSAAASWMLDREYIVPMPLVQSRQPLDSLVAELAASTGDTVLQSLEHILAAPGPFAMEQIRSIDRAVVALHSSCREAWFYQRVFELGLKIHGFSNDWKSRIQACRMHEKHRFKIHSSTHAALPPGTMNGVLRMCQKYMASRSIVYGRTDILAHCLLELNGASEALYEGADDVFYLVEYVYRGDPRTLLRWARNARRMNDWSLLYLTNYPDFLHTELKYLSDAAVLRDAVVQLRSHRLCSFLFIKLSMLFSRDNLLDILVQSHDEAHAVHTADVFRKLFDESAGDGERILKRFIKRTGSSALSEMFYTLCTDIDGDYAEACLTCVDGAGSIETSSLKRLADSQYWTYITHMHRNFVVFTGLLIERGLLCTQLDSFLSGAVEVSAEGLQKLHFVAAEIPGRRDCVARTLAAFVRRVSRNSQRCHGCREQQLEASLSICSITSLARKTEHKAVSRDDLLLIYDILNLLRDCSIPARTVRMLCALDPDLFCRRVVAETRYDCFFVKCMNVVLRQTDGAFRHAVRNIAEMPLFCSDGFWEVAVRQSLRLGHLWRELSEPHRHVGRKEGFYSLRNATVHPEPVRKDVLQERRRRLDGDWTAHLRLFSEETKLRYLVRQLEKKEQNSELVRSVAKHMMHSRIAEGMVFRDSSAVFDIPFSTFSLQLLLVQYEEWGEQVFVQLENGSQVFRMGRTNGKLFMSENKDGHVLLSENSMGTIRIQSFYNGSRFSFSVNGRSYSTGIRNVNRVRIGDGFRGVVSRILLCESHRLEKYVLDPCSQSQFYTGSLAAIEKALVYKNYTGMYMDSTAPYFINGELAVTLRNVLESRPFHWIHSSRLRELSGNVQIADILENKTFG